MRISTSFVCIAASFAVGASALGGTFTVGSAKPVLFGYQDTSMANVQLGHVHASKSGRFVVFLSTTESLVPGLGGIAVVYRLDCATGEVVCPTLDALGQPANDPVIDIAISASGRYVAYLTAATNLGVATGGLYQVIWQDMATGERRLCSHVNGLNAPANAESNFLRISRDGMVVAFDSSATNLVAAPGSFHHHVYTYAVKTGVVTRVSVAPSGAAGNGDSYVGDFSKDGSIVVFTSLATNLDSSAPKSQFVGDVFVRDTVGNTTAFISRGFAGAEPDDSSTDSRISANGRYVAFLSKATNLVANDGDGAEYDAYFFDRKIQKLSRIAGGDEGSSVLDLGTTSLSDDGRYFVCRAGIDHPTIAGWHLNDLRRFDRVTGARDVIHVHANSQAEKSDDLMEPAISGSGKSLLFCSSAKALAAPPIGSLFRWSLPH